MRKLALLAATALAAVPLSQALAWGQTGHRVVGAIAEHYLADEARTAVADLLPGESLAEASTWMDDTKGVPEHDHTRPWHYVTVIGGVPYTPAHAPAEGDAITALTTYTATLRDKAAPVERRREALRAIVHLIGDLHQPLHSGSRQDKGGNDVKVKFFGRGTNLHAVWDSGMIDGQKLSYSEMAAWLQPKIPAETARAWSATEPAGWVAESVALHDRIYPSMPTDGKPDLSWDYDRMAKPIWTERLQQAGVRLAAYLNNALKP